MILIHFTPDGMKRTAELRDIFHGRTAVLIGGAPSLKEQPYQLLEQRGVLTMAMNNAGTIVRPTMFVCGDHPDCYEPQLLLDPTIMKFGPLCWAETKTKQHISDRKFWSFPNMYFYMQVVKIPWDEYLADRAEVPWYSNTLLSSIHILYGLGVRRIILAGSDFMFGKNSDYAHGQVLGSLEKKWNLDLYNSIVRELRLLKPIFERAGLELLDSSKNSRLNMVYRHISLEEAVDMALTGFPKTPVPVSDLPHCSKFAPRDIKEAIAEWPGHSDKPPDKPTEVGKEFIRQSESQTLQPVDEDL